jgi:hypothetical protein
VIWQAELPVCPLSWPTVSINDVSAAEGDAGTTPFNFTVSLSEASPVSVSVAYATADSTAAAGSDYAAAAGTLLFTSGQVSKSLPIGVTGEAAFEPDETFVVNLTPISNAGPGDPQGVGTIVNDDFPPTISVSDVTAPEGAGDSTSFTFTVSLSAASWLPVTVAFATSDGTAAAPVDYAPAAGTLTFAPGESSKPVAVTVYGDLDWESDETFTVNLSAPTNATIADSAGTGTIQNDDSGGGNCETSLVDFGDAPEDSPAYPGVMGHFPTCLYPGTPGDRTTNCGTALGSAPGATGYVKHTQGPMGYWLGCQPGFPLPWGIDSETDGKVNATGGAGSACDPAVSVDCVETIPGYPIAYGQGECYGDFDAAFSASELSVIFGNSCGATSIPLRTFNCGPPRQVYVNLLVDWNSDGDWNDADGCVSDVGCSPEWCLKNATITLPSGCATVNTPIFKLGWNNCSGPRGWMRVTISNNPVSPSFPWNGGLLNGGETEDYLVGGPSCTLGSPPTQQDLGDAPEGIPAYSSGVVGRFPTCTVGTVVTGTQELECEAPGTAPGPSGAVIHSGSGPSLGCSGLNSLLSIDTEGMAAVTSAVAGGEAVACEFEVASDCSQTAFGRTFGQDECTGDVDAGLAAVQLVAGTEASVTMSMARFGTAKTAYLNILADWNADGDWNDALLSGDSQCAPEWAVKNHAFVLESGCSQVASPTFRVGPNAGESWMRITLADEPAPNDFPWKGAFFSSGETEDHPVVILPAPTEVEPGPSGPATWFRPAYPSPARGVTRLRFRLAREADVALTIYSTDGRRIRTLVRGIQAQGEHEIRWDGSDDSGRAASKGLYVVRFSALGQTVNQKLIWLGRR